MTEEVKESVFKGVDLHCKTNNTEHRTSEISVDQLIVRRGQPFNVTLKLKEAFNPATHTLSFVAITGGHPSEERGTKSCFSVPNGRAPSPSAKAVWKIELVRSSSLITGALNLILTPPADAPVGEYIVNVTYKNEEMLLAMPVVLFNPWCPDDWVFMSDEAEKQEYVMNEQGVIYKGSGNYIFPMNWDFGQFEDNMVKICLKILDLNHKHQRDPADDVSARCNPIYVGRVISAMINCQDDHGVLQGRWNSPYWGGVRPTHWNGSHAILKQWLKYDYHPVKYGQCWVFAGVMCSVMRLLGIPCRVVTNFSSAHDTNMNLKIDTYHADYGVREKPSPDSVWNYHVWTEAWMKRPDLSKDGKYDGWQVLDPTPQEKSEGIYCCGPAPVLAILEGQTDLKYDIPFVFAEVNADCVDWLCKADGTEVVISSDTKRVGQNISTKSVGSNKRNNITDTYKHREGSDKERVVFKYACTRDYSRVDETDETEGENMETEEAVDNEGTDENEETPVVVPPPPVSIRFEEVSKLVNGKDVKLNLVLHSESSAARSLSINISAQAMNYNGSPVANIQKEVKEETLQPGKDLIVPILVPFSAYHKPMVDCDSMKISALVMDKQNPENTYLAENDVVLLDPPISITVSGQPRLYREMRGQVIFMNPADETLTNCTLTLSGSGIWRDDIEYKIPDMKPNTRVRVTFYFIPYKIGEKTIVVDFDCSTFRDIKNSCTINVKP